MTSFGVAFLLQIHLLESEKNRLMIATDRLDDAMRARRLKINEARLHRLSQDRVFSQVCVCLVFSVLSAVVA